MLKLKPLTGEAVRLLRLVHHAPLEYYLVEAESQSRKESAAKNE